MRRNEAVRIFNRAREKARATPTWRLKMWACWVRHKTACWRTEENLLKQIALQYELRHRPDASVR
jgi:hypothetical protein